MFVGVIASIWCLACRDVPFCVPWVDTEQQYQVEFLDRVATGPAATYPSCGTTRFLMDTGDVLPMRIRSAGATDCRAAVPVLTIPSVETVDGP